MYEDLKFLKVNLPEDILKLKCNGNFKEAIKLIDLWLQKNLTNAMRKRLEFEKHIIHIIEKEYTYSFEEALNMLCDNVVEFKEEQLIKLQEESSADWILVKGKVKFNNSFYGNLIKTKPDIKERLKKQEDEELNIKKEQLLHDFIKNIKSKGKVSYYVQLKSSLKIKKQAERIGQTVKVHMPVTKISEQTKNINLISTSLEPKFISSLQYPQRTVFFEEKLKENQEFSVEYSYENHLIYNELDPQKVSEIQPTFCLEELEPHIMFTPYIKELALEIIGNETNPLLKARKIYDYITTKIMYSYMRKYFTITNIPEYAALNLKGDCGVQALLFITLCRAVGVPAKWQSGLYVTPYYVGCHDWAQFYIEPYGWLFADPSFGGSAYRNGNKEVWDFYFGNLDPFRMVAASEFQHEFNPPKKHLRYDPYDNQTGEVEYDDKGLIREDFYVNFNLIDMHEI